MKIIKLLLLLSIFIFTGCSQSKKEFDNKLEKGEIENIDPFSIIYYEGSDNCYMVVYHKETKVMYVVSRSSASNGIFTLLVDAEGKPLLYEGEID